MKDEEGPSNPKSSACLQWQAQAKVALQRLADQLEEYLGNGDPK